MDHRKKKRGHDGLILITPLLFSQKEPCILPLFSVRKVHGPASTWVFGGRDFCFVYCCTLSKDFTGAGGEIAFVFTSLLPNNLLSPTGWRKKKGIQKINHRRIEKIVQLNAFVICVSCSSLLFSSLSSTILAWIMWIIISVFKAFAKIWECIYKITTGLLGLVLRILYEINIYPYWCYCFHLSFIIFTIIWNKIPEGRMLKLHYFW